MTLLRIEDLHAAHGLLPAVRGVAFSIAEGEVLALVGANGAGKTTLLRTLAGVHRPASGRIFFDGTDITRMPAHQRVACGISMVLEGRRLFPGMTVEENLLVGASSGRTGPWNTDQVRKAFPQLEKVWKTRATHLSGGEQQATAIGRALMANPRIVLLDEVSLGLSPLAVQGVYDSLRSLTQTRTTIILVEQDLNRSLTFADRIICMLEGTVVAEGNASEMSREQVMAHYFGTHRAAAQDRAVS